MFQYKFSVIMPLYNVENFFAEAVESVIKQTIGFRENIQIILVNDGSPDRVEDLCLRYKEDYPENIIYVSKENGGVSSARNEGIKHAQGKYINFFDADDRWELDAFEKAYAFLEQHNEVDAVACRHRFFGKRDGFVHPLDYKFRQAKDGLVDIKSEHTYIQMAVNAVFFRKDALRGIAFDTRLKISEDSIFVTQVILKKEKYGILPEAVYHYRKRLSNDSAIDFSTSSRTWYFDTPEYCYQELFKLSKKQYGTVIPYIQYLVMYDLQWRLKTLMPENFSQEERGLYKRYLTELLEEIDDEIIWEQKYLPAAYKIFALEMKYKEKVVEQAELRKPRLFYRGIAIFNVKERSRFKINILEVQGKTLLIEGITTLNYLGERCRLYVKGKNGKEFPLKLYKMGYEDQVAFTGKTLLYNTGFRVELPLESGKDFTFVAEVDGQKLRVKPWFGYYGKLDHKLSKAYYAEGGYLFKYEDDKIKCRKDRKKSRIKAEWKYMRELLQKRKGVLILYRALYYWKKIFKKKPIWILSDRTNMARDNGEHLFRYLADPKRAGNQKIYFVLDKKSNDFQRLTQYGKVLCPGTIKYKLNFLLADKIISSQASPWVQNAFDTDRDFMKNLYKFDFVFLQHGIIKAQLSDWLHKQKQNIKIFITSAERERSSLLEGGYGYTEKEIVLTGLPRFDALKDQKQKKIVIMPTWRKTLAGPIIYGNSERPYQSEFKNSEYFQFYNNLINDAELLRALKDYGYMADFYLHPVFKNQAVDFTGNETIRVVAEAADYTRIFNEAALLLTDYSSIYFDFAYLKKPVVYTLFDVEEFYREHYQKGYFDYEADGFGPCCYDYTETVKTLIACMKDGCQMEKKYRERVEQFFAWTDQNNCSRVYDKLL
ncbi:bifunctional glycosyltransferase/CDP-glycerol:glycerophosphate glycerophosphotransferase [Zhenpiania hominis]|uniref:CDP-glycerol glycerophosphotransferase family protein n=1 Tax=Zhenpiania hominis TaxID=2763644 RepID=A0A923SRR7_9FIRM|nr:CDP-glycerol glycerophosphotransferase family protein [Zhenpiania hominis]MBC6680860.1 CDP-glycerol glycerophosphotransferase family protein [Zhenpiania hominis]